MTVSTLANAGTPAPARHDVYALIHKALRAAMTDALLTLGSVDATDAREASEAIAKVSDLLDLCAEHLALENRFVHVAMEARRPGSTRAIAGEHVHHESAIASLRGQVAALARAPAAARERCAADLYGALGGFVGENLVHMQQEEVDHNAVLWATHSDAELVALENAIKASVPPPQMGYILRWMLPAASPAQRAQMLRGMRAHAPGAVFERVLAIARAHLDAPSLRKLDVALAA